MKIITCFLFVIGLFLISGCSTNSSSSSSTSQSPPSENQLLIRVENREFKAAMLDSPTVQQFKRLLPLTLTMNELNGNEKYYELPDSLPTQSEAVCNIQAGDLMLYGSNTFVLFYENLSTSYSYTRLGSILEAEELKTVLGNKEITVTIELVPFQEE